ncbi:MULTISPECIES: VOC family protein [Prauserella]|nr:MULTISPECIES: VOC family protein [Prauserella]
MATRLRQVALIAQQLDPVVDDVRAVFGLEVGFTAEDEIALRGPGLVDEFGITNAVLPVGDTFLEVISPQRPDTPAARFLAARGGDSGYMVLLQCSGLAEVRRRLAEAGVREVWESPLPDIHGVHLDPRDTGGILFSVEEPDDPAEWPWAGPNWRAARRIEVSSAIVGAELKTADPWASARQWGHFLDRPVTARPDGTPLLHLGATADGWIGFRPGAHPRDTGLHEVVLRCADPADVLHRAASRDLPVADGAAVVAGVLLRPEGD